jgi:hypothetical protein
VEALKIVNENRDDEEGIVAYKALTAIEALVPQGKSK